MRNGRAGRRRRRRRGDLPEHRAAVLPELRAVRARRRSPRTTSTGSPASAPTTAGSSTSAAEFPERRAGIGQIFLNDIDDAIDDVKWIKEHGLRGGVLLPTVPPDVDVGEAAATTPTTTGCGRCAKTSSVPVNCHGGTGAPDYGAYPSSALHSDHRGRRSTRSRPLVLHAAVGRVRALPEAQVRDDRAGLRVDPAVARAARRRRSTACADSGRDRRAALQADEHILPKSATEYFQQNVLAGREPARPGRRRAPRTDDRASTGSCGAATTRTTRARTRSRASTCARCSTTGARADDAARSSPSNAAEALRLRPRRARAARGRASARPSPSSRSRSPSCPPSPTPPS